MVKLRAKVRYFGRDIFKTDWDKINRTPLQRAGMFVMRGSRMRIRSPRGKDKNRPSPKGQSPRTRARGDPMRKIFTVADRLGTRQLVGFAKFGGDADPVPFLQEHGVGATRRVITNWREFKKARLAKLAGKRKRTGVKKQFAMKRVQYPERPTVGPALEKAKTRLPAFWRNSIKG